MAIGPRLDLRQSQSLVMTPQLQQAIRLLALSNQELEAVIAEEVDKNPLLEMGESGVENTVPVEDTGPVEADNMVATGSGEGAEALDMEAATENLYQDSAADTGLGLDGGLSMTGESGSIGDDGTDFDSFAARASSLTDHLLSQIGAILNGEDLAIAAAIIDELDDAGYLAARPFDLAQRFGVPQAQIDRAIATVQTLDPTGVGARTLGECLALQAKEADRYDPAMAVFLDNLDLLAEGRMAQLKRICGVDDEDLADMIRELRGYDPKPGLKFSSAPTESVTPDLFVRQTAIGWAIEINSATLPRVLVNRSYYAELAAGGQDKASKAWLNECMANANWLMKALDQRQRTIIKVASEIVKRQEGFFRDGVAFMKPLTLRVIAEEIGMHESTISRVTSNKYLSCSRGVFELKYFFSSGVATEGGEGASAESVKSRIRALITAETPDAILSDDTLVEMLNKEGFGLARRTVAKYREAIGLGSSVQRRRQKAISARAA